MRLTDFKSIRTFSSAQSVYLTIWERQCEMKTSIGHKDEWGEMRINEQPTMPLICPLSLLVSLGLAAIPFLEQADIWGCSMAVHDPVGTGVRGLLKGFLEEEAVRDMFP